MNIESLIKELKKQKKNFNIRAETKYLYLIFEMSDFYFRWSSPRKNSLYDLSSMGSKWFFRVDKLKLGSPINRSPVIIHGYNPIGLFFQRMWLASVNEPVYTHAYIPSDRVIRTNEKQFAPGPF